MGTHFKSINIQSFLKMKAVFILIAGLALTNAAPAADGNQLSYIENLINRLFHGVDPLQKCDPPCKNGGSCLPDNTCDCPTFDNWAYEGDDCSIGPCNPESTTYWPCYNAGNCHEQPILPFGAECLCQSDCGADPPNCFSGPHCDYLDQCKIDFIEDGSSCSDHGYCTNDDTVSGFTCLCEPGWLGEKCADQDVCYPNQCQNDGLCVVDDNGEPKCECQDGYFGDKCQYADPCRISPCYNGGTCTIDDNGTPQCKCPDGYSGEFCESNVCIGEDCGHGNCIIVGGLPECDCHKGWEGDHCDQQVNPDPTTEGPNPTTEGPEPTTERPSPTTAEPEPTTEEPKPTTAEPEPTTMEPETTTEEPKPTSAEPQPTTEEVITTTKKFTFPPKGVKEPLRFHRTN